MQYPSLDIPWELDQANKWLWDSSNRSKAKQRTSTKFFETWLDRNAVKGRPRTFNEFQDSQFEEPEFGDAVVAREAIVNLRKLMGMKP